MRSTIDLSPLFGTIAQGDTVSVTLPGEGVLEQRLAELSSEDAAARRRALIDLRYFPEAGEKVVPALLAILDGEDANLRMLALSVLRTWPDLAAPHTDTFLAILTDEKTTEYERSNAAYLVAAVAPESEVVVKALSDLIEKNEGMTRRRFESALRMYRNRFPAPEQD